MDKKKLTPKMRTIQLTPELEALINQQIATGQYQNDLAVIAEGLRLLAEREIYQGKFEELKREIMIGVEQFKRGEGIDGKQVFAELEQELQSREAEILFVQGEDK